MEYLLGITEYNSSASKFNYTAEVIAAHIDDDTSDTEREQIINFTENLKEIRKQE